MKNTAIMVGDWVTEHVTDYDKYEYAKDVRVKPNNLTQTGWINNLTVIPLTASILEKNGFERIASEMCSYSKDGFSIVVDFFKDKISIMNKDLSLINRYKIKGVHNFQHILKENGYITLAENFKI